MTQIIELDTIATVKQVANCADSFPAFVQARFGNRASVIFKHVVDGKVEGTVRKGGKFFDVWWTGEKYRAVEA